jgi:hypothetical protein
MNDQAKLDYCDLYNKHEFLGNPNVLEMLLGRAPTTTYEQFARRAYEEHAAQTTRS